LVKPVAPERPSASAVRSHLWPPPLNHPTFSAALGLSSSVVCPWLGKGPSASAVRSRLWPPPLNHPTFSAALALSSSVCARGCGKALGVGGSIPSLATTSQSPHIFRRARPEQLSGLPVARERPLGVGGSAQADRGR
jgi:hypothetical protein